MLDTVTSDNNDFIKGPERSLEIFIGTGTGQSTPSRKRNEQCSDVSIEARMNDHPFAQAAYTCLVFANLRCSPLRAQRILLKPPAVTFPMAQEQSRCTDRN